MRSIYEKLVWLGNGFSHFFLLVVRLFWGPQFIMTGFGKLIDPHSIATYFSTLNIPFPLFNAYLVGWFELLGGVFLVLGLFSRLFSLPLIVILVVAYLTADYDATKTILSNPQQFLMRSPFSFLMAALTIFSFGPGIFSLDALYKLDSDRSFR